MKHILFYLFFISLLLSKNVQSQDYIYLKNNDPRIAAEIIKIGDEDITYKIYGQQEGPLNAIKVKKVKLIAFENGEVKYFSSEANIELENFFNKNVFSLNIGDLIFSNFTLSYERLSKNGKTGFKIPISAGYGHYANIDDMINRFYTGLSVNFYPTGQGKWRFYTGPELRVGVAQWNYYNYTCETTCNSTNYNELTGYTKLMINLGVIYTPVKQMSVSFTGGIGVRYVFKYPANYNYVIRTTGAIGINISYRF